MTDKTCAILDKSAFYKCIDFDPESTLLCRTLGVLYMLQEIYGLGNTTAYQISKTLVNTLKLSGSPAGVKKSLDKAPYGYVRRRNGVYTILQPAIFTLKLKPNKEAAFLVMENTPFTSKILLEEKVLKNLSGTILVCDPYISERTLDMVVKVIKGSNIKILTSNIKEESRGSLNRQLHDLTRQGYQVEVRVLGDFTLHDRYIMDDSHMWIIGHSIKDLGNKESFVIELSGDIKQAAKQLFEDNWNKTSATL